MNTCTGNLAQLSGGIILHGVNGGWIHGPKFGAGFAAEIAARDLGARQSYLEAWGAGPDEPRIYTDERPWLRGWGGAPEGKPGIPLGYIIPHRLSDGTWLLHGVTQPYVRGTVRPVGKDKVMRPDSTPATLSAVSAVLEGAARFMRSLALREGRARELHCTRLGCGLGGLEWGDVRECIERVESTANAPLKWPHLQPPDVVVGRRFPVEFNVWGRTAEEVAA